MDDPSLEAQLIDEAARARSVLDDEHVGTRVIRGGAQRAAGFMAANLLTAISALVLLRYLGVSAFGRYGTVLALVGIVYGISDMGLTVTGTRELTLCRTDEERRDLLGHILGLRFVITTLGALVALAFALLAGYGAAEVVGTALAGLGTILQSVQAAMLLPLGVQLRNGALAANQVLTQAVLLVGFAILALAGAGLVLFFAVQILIGVVILTALPLMLDRSDIVAPRWHLRRMMELARIGLPIAAATVLGVLYLRILVIVMSLISGQPRQIGYYVTSTRVLELVGGLPFLVIALVLPVVTVAARDNRDRLVSMTARTGQAMLLLGVLTALVLWTLSAPIVDILGGTGYAPASKVLRIQGFATITIFLSAAWQPTLIGLGRMRALTLAMAGGVAAVLISGLILVPSLQAEGAAYAAVIGDVTLCALVYVGLHRAQSAPWMPRDAVLRVAAATAPAVALGLIPGVAAVPRALLVCGAFGGLAWLLGALPSELVAALRSSLTRLSGARRS